MASSSSPTLLRSLAGDTEPGTDLSPGVAAVTQALDSICDGAVDLVSEASHEGKCFHVAAPNPAAVGAQDAADKGGILIILDLPSWAF
jgi:hypothetical protein